MTHWIKRIHMYIGLLNFSILLVYGIAGLTATFESNPQTRERPEAAVTYRDFQLPPNLDDLQAAEAVNAFLALPLAGPIPRPSIRRDAGHDLGYDLYSMNGPTRVTLLEAEHRVRIETRRNNLWHYIDNLHSTTMNARVTDLRVRLWAAYNEFAIWSLIAMSVSGAYLWLASRPRFRWAQLSFAAGSGAFLLLYVLTR